MTNQPEIVAHAKYCNEHYPTIENRVPKDKNVYSSSLEDFALVDSKLMKANTAIGESSNLAQLALTYSYNFDDQKYQDAICILSVLAQICIDNAKRSFDIDFIAEIKRLKKELDVEQNGKPYFWYMLKRKGKFANTNPEKQKLMEGLNPSLICPMNYVCEVSFFPKRTSEETLPMDYFFQPFPLQTNKRISKKLEDFVEKYSVCQIDSGEESIEMNEQQFEEMMDDLRGCSISKQSIGVMSNLLDRAFRITSKMKATQDTMDSNLWRNKPLLIKILYTLNRSCLQKCLSKNVNH